MLFGNIFKANCKPTDQAALLSKEEFLDAISNSDTQLVDLRTAYEYRSGNIKGSVNIDFFQPTVFEAKFERFDKNKPLYIYCRSGARSQRAAMKLSEMGFKQIFDLRGGFTAWNA